MSWFLTMGQCSPALSFLSSNEMESEHHPTTRLRKGWLNERSRRDSSVSITVRYPLVYLDSFSPTV